MLAWGRRCPGEEVNTFIIQATSAVALLLLLIVAGCSKKFESGPETQACDKSIPGTGKSEKMANPQKASSCQLAVMFCHYCAYNPDGSFKEAGSEPCGVCLGGETK